MLDKRVFEEVVKNTPLISIDLVVKNRYNEILLGRRVNEPAKGYWFVPGGRIFKDESLSKAFQRICKSELNSELSMDDADFYGVYEHFYDNNVFNAEFSTHYVVLAYGITLKDELDLPSEQHSDYIWTSVKNLLKSGDVHRYTKDYIKEERG